LTVLPERYSSTSLVAAADVLFDTAYVLMEGLLSLSRLPLTPSFALA
jgi:hypothetical protein